jgi:hypothetical protein
LSIQQLSIDTTLGLCKYYAFFCYIFQEGTFFLKKE